MPLTDEQVGLLNQTLDPSIVAQRDAGGSRKVSYLEGHEAIGAANRIFGYGNWGHTVERIDYKQIGDGGMYTAVVTVTVEGCHLHQDVGVGVVNGRRANDADEHDKAYKTAVTDALKRALRVYGDSFGLSLYDKDNEIHAQVKAQQYDKTSDLHKQAGQQSRAPQQARPAVSQPTQVQQPPISVAQLKSILVGLLAKDPEGAGKVPKLVEDMNETELVKTTEWLRARASRKGV